MIPEKDQLLDYMAWVVVVVMCASGAILAMTIFGIGVTIALTAENILSRIIFSCLMIIIAAVISFNLLDYLGDRRVRL